MGKVESGIDSLMVVPAVHESDQVHQYEAEKRVWMPPEGGALPDAVAEPEENGQK